MGDAEFIEKWYREHGSLAGLPARLYVLNRTVRLSWSAQSPTTSNAGSPVS